MSKLYNRDLAKVLAAKFKLDRGAAETFVNCFFDSINDGLKYDRQVKVRGLGTFKVTAVAARKSVDVNTGEPIVIEGRDKINFTADTSMRDQVNRPFAQFETVMVNDGVNFDEIDEKFAESMIEQDDSEESDEKDVAKNEVAKQTEELSGDETPNSALTAGNAPDKEEAGKTENASVDEGEEVVDEERGAMLNETSPDATESETVRDSASDPSSLEPTKDDAEKSFAEEENLPSENGHDDDIIEHSGDQLTLLNQDDVQEDCQKQAVTTAKSEMESADMQDGVQPTEPDKINSSLKMDAPIEVEEAVQTDSVELELVKKRATELQEAMGRQHKFVKLLVVAGVVLLAVCIGTIAYLSSQLAKRDNRIQHLEAEENMPVNTYYGDTASRAVALEHLKKQETADSMKTAAVLSESQKELATPVATTKQKDNLEKLSSNANKKRQLSNDANVAQAEKKKLPARSDEKSKRQVQVSNVSNYDKDARVRTGAYKIIGIDRTLTVRKGQTLRGISNANLGPGMECYVEAVNNGRTEFKEGEKIKIPKLQLKKR